jgi:ABC-type nitrate/sulfonate/bicarbonate transport system substrate-binding protein
MPEPLATSALQQGVGVVLDRNPLPGALGTVLIFGPSLLEEPGGDKAARVLRALRKAASELTAPERIMSAENVAIWAKYSELPPPLVARTAPYVFDARLGVSVSDLSKQQEFLRQSGQISASLALEKVLDRRLAAELP